MKVTIVTILVLFTAAVTNAQIGGDTKSTLKIIAKLCYGFSSAKNLEGVPEAFADCYNKTDSAAKEVFLKCQKDSFEAILDTKDSISTACFRPWKLVNYSRCLKKEFGDRGLDMNAAVTAVNICQAVVVGVD